MKLNSMAFLVIATFMISCSKENIQDNLPAPVIYGETSGRETCEPFPFGLLALDNGNMTINGLTSITGDVGYSANVVSTNNVNVGNFSGSIFRHNLVSSFVCGVTSFLPLNGIIANGDADGMLDQANFHASNLSELYKILTPSYTFSTINTNKTILINPNSETSNTVVNIGSINLSNETLTLKGTLNGDDGFIINVTGNMTLTNSKINLVNIRPERVLFNFPNNGVINLRENATIFRGTILAPKSNVIYLNPKRYEGSIVAKKITAASSTIGLYLPINVSNNSGCGDNETTEFIQRTYCNGYQWN